jgi:hypothetical protein
MIHFEGGTGEIQFRVSGVDQANGGREKGERRREKAARFAIELLSPTTND